MINLFFWGVLSVITFIKIVCSDKLAFEYLIFIPVILISAVILHYCNGKKDNKYLEHVLGLSNEKTRNPQYDYLRLLAMLFVIITHAVQIDFSKNLIHGEWMSYFMKVVAAVSMCCNTLYVMLSGALLLPYRKDESIFKYYSKRISSVAIPMVVYILFYKWYSFKLVDGNLHEIKDVLKTIYYGHFIESPHFWILCVLLSFYIVSPFLRYMFKEIPYRWITYMVIISVIWGAIPLFVKPHFVYESFLGDWIGVAIIGYWITRRETEKYYDRIMYMGVAAFVVELIIVKCSENYLQLCCNISPICLLITMALICFVLRNKKLFNRGNAVLNILSKYGFSIILVHWWTIHYVTINIFDIKVEWMYGAGVIISLFLTLIVSLGVAFIIDNTFLLVARKWFDIIINRFYICLKKP